MNRVELAFRSFFWILFKRSFADKIEEYFIAQPDVGLLEEKKVLEIAPPPQPTRNDAVQLLALLQREGRLIDFLKEPIDAYSDAQIGAAVRDIHRDCASVLERVFEVKPLVEKEEGASITVAPGFDPEQFRLTGNVAGDPPYEGFLRHHGWRVSKTELPIWNGNDESAEVIAPAEIELP
ncbi:MAG: DUF2760 domain-containing protein [Fibrobacter sp.]|nr:DUF2760 domain-containing protein [Fibrobacter sp.]